MANTSKSTTQPRFGRTSAAPPAGRFGRQATGTNQRRFNRPGTAASKSRGTSRTASPWARSSGRSSSSRFSRGGRSAKQKGLAGTLAGLLPTGAAAKATPSSKKGKAGGFAALAAAAGVAFRNRDKLTSMIGGGKESHQEPTAAPMPPETATAVPPAGNTAGSIPRTEGGTGL